MGIRRFEEIEAWQAARDLCKIIYRLTGDDKFHKDYGLRDQARKTAVSIMANIAEGFDSRSNPEFIQFLYYSLRSASELQSHLYIAKDQGYIAESQFARVYKEGSKVKGLIFRFIAYLRTHDKPVSKPRTSNVEHRTEKA